VPAFARQGAASAVHCAFDLLELESRDHRRKPIEEKKAAAREAAQGLAFEHCAQ